MPPTSRSARRGGSSPWCKHRRAPRGARHGDWRQRSRNFWTDFLRSLARRGLRGVKLVISDAHVGLKAAANRVLGAAAQRCRVHFMRNVLVHAGKGHRRFVSLWIATAFAEPDLVAARKQWRSVADQLRPRVPKLAALTDTA